MWRSLLCVFIVCYVNVNYVVGFSRLCDNSHNRTTLSCTTEILGEGTIKNDICKIKAYPADSSLCGAMNFGPLMPNTHIGGVTLKPYIMMMVHDKNVNPYAVNHTVLNITFSNIKWKSMSFRFQDKYKDLRNHCRTINISNDAIIDDQSVLYYDCYWTKPGERNGRGQSHILDFEARGDGVVNRGQYYFNVPSAEMLSPVAKPEEWKPFIYIEIFPSKMRLHIPPPPSQLRITSYGIEVMKECGKDFGCKVKSSTVNFNNRTDDVTYDYNFVGENGLFYFIVTPKHKGCDTEGRCMSVESPKIKISSESQAINICIASVTALIVATLFAYYVALRIIRRYWCRDNYKLAMAMEIPPPTKVLVIYSPANRLHGECVVSFVTYLRTEYGLDIMYDGDIATTSHGDPYIWAEEAFRLASHIMYIVSPAQETNPNIYDKPIISAHKDVDVLLLSFIKASRASRCPKDILNVYFEHSNGTLPSETRPDKTYFLLKDWQKLVSHLSKNLLPKRQIMRTEKGRCFLEDLTRAKKMLSIQRDEVLVRCDRNEKNATDKKILL